MSQNWHILFRFATWPIAQPKYFVAYTLQKRFFIVRIKFSLKENCSTWLSARIVVSNWKYSRLYNIRVHYKILANQGGRGRFSFKNFVSSATRKV